MKDLIRMNQLAGVITEGQAKKMMKILKEVDFDDEDDDDDDFDLEAAFKKSPNQASYEDVLFIIKSFEDDEIIDTFTSKFPQGKPISKKAYVKFIINNLGEEDEYTLANWIHIYDKDIFDKADL
jgi:hypothetical protein